MQTDPLAQLSFAEPTAHAVDLWAANLPLVNTAATAEQLLMACDEMARLDATAILRFDLLDTVRPLVHYVSSRLHRTASATGPTAETLAASLADAYGACFESCRDKDMNDKECRDILYRSAHRMFSEQGRLALYCAQRYHSLPSGYWQYMHEAFAFLQQLELTENKLADTNESEQPTTVAHMYLRNLLFASCKPNQINQQDLLYTFNVLELWAQHASLEAPSHASLLLVDLQSDRGPVIRSKRRSDGDWRALNAEILCYEAEAFVNEVNTILPVPEYVTPKLIHHLVQAWSIVQPRNFRRISSADKVRVSLGLRAVHYFLAGAVDFSEQIANTDAVLRREVNPFLDVDYEPMSNKSDDDPWSYAHDLKTRIPENPNIENPDALLRRHHTPAEKEPRKYDHYELTAMDTSPGGYRLRWDEPMPAGVQVGDLVGLRDENDSRWCVAVLRWISGQGEFGEIGLQLLAPRAIPVAVRLIQKKGGSAGYSRGLLLPGLEAIGQAATMITPSLPFKAGQKIIIHRQGLQSTGMLQEVLLNTESFNQFSFRMLDGYLENPARGRNMDALSAMTREDSTRGP
ncbi:MAG: hypothetical protein RIC89_12035 [Pseudomonadales bacterium]